MAKFVLLEFDDDKEAELFAMQGGMLAERAGVDTMVVVGIFRKPTKYCDCKVKGLWSRQDGWTMGRKYGWWVHNRCGRPSKQWAEGMKGSLGRNLFNA